MSTSLLVTPTHIKIVVIIRISTSARGGSRILETGGGGGRYRRARALLERGGGGHLNFEHLVSEKAFSRVS